MSWTLTRMRLPLRCTEPSKDVANAELLADPLQVDMFSLVSESGVATNHETADHARQIRRQALSDTIDKMLLLRVAALAKGSITMERLGARGTLGITDAALAWPIPGNGICPNRSGDILEALATSRHHVR